MFCGVNRVSGCSTVCFRTAEILAAQKRGTVCLVDANLRAPSLHRHFRIENRAGFSDSLVKPESMQGLAQQIQGSKLWVVTSGTALDVSLPVCSERLQSQILTLRTVFDYVLVDVAPVSLSWDAIMLGQLLEGTVLVIDSRSASREAARETKETLKAANIRILGAVVNDRAPSPPAKQPVAKSAPQPEKRAAQKDIPRDQKKSLPENSPRPAPRLESVQPVAGKIEASKSEVPQVEMPLFEIPVFEIPNIDNSNLQTAKAEATQPEAAKLEPAKADGPKPAHDGNGHPPSPLNGSKPATGSTDSKLATGTESKPAATKALAKVVTADLTKPRKKRRFRLLPWPLAGRAKQTGLSAKPAPKQPTPKPAPKDDKGRRPAAQAAPNPAPRAWNKPIFDLKKDPPAGDLKLASDLKKDAPARENAAPAAATTGPVQAPKPNSNKEQPQGRPARPAAETPIAANSKAAKPSAPKPETRNQEETPAWSAQSSPSMAPATWRTWIPIASMWTVAIGMTVWFAEMRGVFHAAQQPREVAAMVVGNPLGLQVDRTGDMLDILWDRNSVSASNSNGGSLTIRDGDEVKHLGLDAGEIRTGHLYYRPRHGDLDIRLEVAAENGGTATESVRLVGAPVPAPAPPKSDL